MFSIYLIVNCGSIPRRTSAHSTLQPMTSMTKSRPAWHSVASSVGQLLLRMHQKKMEDAGCPLMMRRASTKLIIRSVSIYLPHYMIFEFNPRILFFLQLFLELPYRANMWPWRWRCRKVSVLPKNHVATTSKSASLVPKSLVHKRQTAPLNYLLYFTLKINLPSKLLF